MGDYRVMEHLWELISKAQSHLTTPQIHDDATVITTALLEVFVCLGYVQTLDFNSNALLCFIMICVFCTMYLE